jgi:hypothetical protein
MPAVKAFAFEQLERLADFPGAPEEPEAFRERAEFLAVTSADNETCRRITDRLLAGLRYFPLPTDIQIAAEDERRASEPEWSGHARGCSQCGDTGWRIASGGVVRCSCRGENLQRNSATSSRFERDWPDHPEIAIGIPPGIVSGKSWYARERKAAESGYTGPLTLSAAIDSGRISREQARQTIARWEAATGQTFRVVERERSLVRTKPAASSLPALAEKVS